MNKRLGYINLFLLRLPMFMLINTALNLIVFISYKSLDVIKISIFFFLLFTVLFVAKEAIMTKRASVIARLVICFAFWGMVSLLFSGATFTALIIASIYLYLIHSLISDVYDFKNSFLSENRFFAAFILILLLLVYYRNEYLFKFVAFEFIILILVRHICFQFKSMDWFINSYKCSGQSKQILDKVTVNGLKLILLYTSLLLVFSVILIFGEFNYIDISLTQKKSEHPEISIESNVSTQHIDKDFVHERFLNTKDPNPDSIADEYSPAEPVSNIIKWIIATVIFLGILVLAVAFSKKNLLFKNNLDDIEITETEDCDEMDLRKRVRGAENSINRRIRRIFISKVKEYRKPGYNLLSYFTARKIMTDIGQHEDVSALNELYHRARYGNEIISKDELGMIKNASFLSKQYNKIRRVK